MKKVLVLLLAIVLVLSACGTASAPAEPLTLAQFEEKYKRADWDEMLSSPASFFEDLHGISNLPFDQAIPDAASLESTEEIYGTVYEKELILFNRAFTATINNYDKFFSCSLFYEGDPEECYSAFKTLFESLIKAYGDPATMSVDRDDVDEVAIRKALDAGDLSVPVSAQWVKKAEPDNISLALISYWNFTVGTLSFY